MLKFIHTFFLETGYSRFNFLYLTSKCDKIFNDIHKIDDPKYSSLYLVSFCLLYIFPNSDKKLKMNHYFSIMKTCPYDEERIL